MYYDSKTSIANERICHIFNSFKVLIQYSDWLLVHVVFSWIPYQGKPLYRVYIYQLHVCTVIFFHGKTTVIVLTAIKQTNQIVVLCFR